MTKTSNVEPHGLHATQATRGTRSALLAGAKGMIWRDSQTESVGQIRDMTVVGLAFTDNEDGTGVLTAGGTAGEGQTDTTAVTVDMLNNSGGDLPVGATVVVDDTEDEAVTTTTDAASTLIAGVTADVIQDGEVGPVIFNGYAADVVTEGDVARGEYAQTSTTAGAAGSTADREAGSFGVFLAASGIPDFAEWIEVTEEPDDSTSLSITLQTVTIGRVLFIALYLDPALGAASVTLTGWTRIGSTTGFRYYYRVATGSDTATASWTGASPAVAIAAQLNELVDAADPVEDFDYDSTTAAAAVSGLSAAPRYAIAGVAAVPETPADWTGLAASSVLSVGGSSPADLAQGVTLSQDPGNDVNWTNPSRVNDGNTATGASVGSGPAPYSSKLIADLGSAAAVSTMWGQITDSGPDQLDDPEYSDDGSSWTTITGSWGPKVAHNGTLMRQFTVTGGSTTHRYFRAGKASAAGGHGNWLWTSWEIIGTVDTTVSGTLIGQYIGEDSTATSPYTGAGAQDDAIFAFNLTERPKTSLLLFGPDLGGSGSGATFGTPALTFGTSNTAGSTDEVIRRDAQLALFDATVPSTQAFGDSAAAGSAGVASRRDHKHAMPSLGTGATNAAAGNHTHVGGGGDGWDSVIVKANDTGVTNSTTLITATDLQFSITAGEVWRVELEILYTADGTGDMRAVVNHSTGTATLWSRLIGTDSLTNALLISTGQRDTGGAGTTALAGGGSTAIVRHIYYECVFTNAGTGTVQLQFAQNVATPGQTATIKAGSIMRLKKLI